MFNFLKKNQTPHIDHSKVRALDPYDFQVAHKRLAWMFRGSVILNVCLAATVISTVAVIKTMLPLKEVRVALIKADSQANQVYRVEPISPETDGYNLVIETISRGFIVDAFSINPLSNSVRAASARKVMTKKYQDKYLKNYVNNGWLQEVMDSGLIRGIIIESTNHYDRESSVNKHLISIDYIQIDSRNGVEIDRKRMRAFMKLDFIPQAVKEADLYVNPFGVFVEDVTITEIQHKD